MKVGVFVPLIGPYADARFVQAAGQGAEERGFATIWTGEHAVTFDDYQPRYPYTDDGRMSALHGDRGMLEPFTTLSYLAAMTQEIRLGTGVLLVPLRNPVHTAKEATGVDWLSGGRLNFGVGVGWMEEEFGAVGLSYADRGARCRAYVEVIISLWSESVSEYHGKHYDLPACRQFPKPIQTPHPPIFFGGDSPAALRRVADLGQGWYSLLLPDELRPKIAELDNLLQERGRSLGDIQIVASPYMREFDERTIDDYLEAGVDEVILLAMGRDRDGLLRRMDELAPLVTDQVARS